MLYLATFTLVTTPYLGRISRQPMARLVEAHSVAEAHAKLLSHFESQSVDHSVSYRVEDVDCSEPIR